VDLYTFEKNILKKNNINLKHLVLNYDNSGVFDEKHLQAFLEIQTFILNFLNYKDFIEENMLLNIKNKYNKNPTFLKIFKIIDNEKKIFNLNMDSQKVCAQFFTMTLLQVLNNKLTLSEKDDFNNRWCGVYDIFENFDKTLEKFCIFFKNGVVVENFSKKSNRELTALILNFGVFSGFLKKKTEDNKGGKKSVFYCLAILPNFTLDWIFIDLKIYFSQPTIIDDGLNKYTCGYHYLSISKIFRENIKSDRFFILKN
jgi:hypothetical protein